MLLLSFNFHVTPALAAGAGEQSHRFTEKCFSAASTSGLKNTVSPSTQCEWFAMTQHNYDLLNLIGKITLNFVSAGFDSSSNCP